ncbi:MAG: TadE/TadG family type IV pilus assembly protein [Acidobacteriaceae bacterium]|nr:TadE/TadG family type IV pilus assembly protein [Acidobacteriaceae bacterium]
MKNFRALEESGQALIELAISLPLLLSMLLGMSELGNLFYCAIEVTNSARAAAQYATMNGGAFSITNSSGLDTTGMLQAAQSDSNNLGTAVSFSSTPTYSCTCADGTANYSCNVVGSYPSGCSSSHLIVTVTVHTQGTFTPRIKIPGLPASYILQGSSIEEVLQ